MAGVFDIDIDNPDVNQDDSDDDAIDLEEGDYDQDPNVNAIIE
ncbi:unnamed protein product, partial [Timema podura]|nr:unnamed protein product [Timema podura]